MIRVHVCIQDALFLPFQACFGYLLFGEALSLRWWIGTVLIVAGIAQLGREGGEEARGQCILSKPVC